MRRTLDIPESLSGERADAGVAKLLGLSRTAAADILRDGGVVLNGRILSKSDRLNEGDLIEIEIPEPRGPLELKPTPVDSLRVIFQDEYLVVIDKPAGVAAHPSVGWDGPTVGGALLAQGIQLSTSGAQERQGIVQRLDVGTSGLMLLAKSELAYSRLKQAFRDRAVHKIYHAIIQGLPDPLSGTFDAPIGRHPRADFKFAVMENGKPSRTHYKTLEAFRSSTLVEVNLETGRTHQIRVHFSAFRHPLIGDTMYGADPTVAAKLGLNRQWLQATQLSFDHPISGDRLTFNSEYPSDLQRVLDELRMG
jgi:23S rRNA pseudouridine1911/1915/1917 synthase